MEIHVIFVKTYGNYTIDMECCKHSICWNCLIRCYLNNFDRCNYCRCKMDTNPFIVGSK